MSDSNPNLLKLDMQITAKRLKLKDKSTNILLRDEVLQNTYTKKQVSTKFASPASAGSKKSLKENKNLFSDSRHSKKKSLSRFTRRPVGYTWNRGGRLKEIRIRTQARKFLYLWINKTFGKMTFSQVQRFYLKKIKSKHFEIWKSVWWENCGEMKMYIRAEYFNRYQLYSKVWVVWKKFVHVRRKKKELQSRASSHFSVILSKKFINLWKIYVAIRKTKKNLYERAYTIANITLTKKVWSMWCQSLQQKRLNEQNYQKAIFHCDDFALKKAFNTWSCRFSEHAHMKKLNEAADEKLSVTLTKKYFLCWCEYVRNRQRKYALYDKARSLFNLSLKHKYLCIWWLRYENLLERREKVYTCQILCIKATKRKYFSAWTYFVFLRKCERRQQAIAQIHHRRSLLRRSFEVLKLSVLLKHKKMYMLFTAQRFYISSLLKRFWYTWQTKIELIEENDLSELSQLARDHCRSRLVKKSFKALHNYQQWRKSRKKNVLKAETHFVVKILPRCFNDWRRFVDEIKDINQMKKDADSFNKELLCTKYFFSWYSAYEQTCEDRTRQRMAVMMLTENTLRHHFELWRHKTQVILSSNRNDAVARVHYRRSLLRVGVRCWKQYTQNSLTRQRKMDQAGTYYKEGLRAWTWLAWKQYVTHCCEKRSELEKASEHHNNHLLQKSMASWKMGVDKAKAIKDQVQQKFENKCRVLMHLYFLEWRKVVISIIQKKESNNKAFRHRQQHLEATVFTRWRHWVILRKFKNDQKQQTLDRAVAALNKLKLQRVLHFWRESKDAMKLQSFQLATAHHHYHTRVCKVVFQAWQLHNFIMLKKKLMERQGAVLRRKLVLQTCIERWKEVLQLKYDETNKTGDALWHWATSLQGRCFDNWRCYVAEKKRKKKRYELAMDARRSHLIKGGCVKMLHYHANAVAQRTQYQACQQAKATYTAYHLAWKYGKRWINKVRQKMRSKTISPSFNTSAPFSFDQCHESRITSLGFKPWLSKPSPIVKERLSSPNVSRSSIFQRNRLVSEKQRPPPRLPDFLDDSLRREGLFNDYLTNDIQTSPRTSPRRVQRCESPHVQRHDEPAAPSKFYSESTSSSASTMSPRSPRILSSTSETMLPPRKEPQTRPDFYETHPHSSHSPDVRPPTQPSEVVLLPPSAFVMPSSNRTAGYPDSSDSTSDSSSATLDAESSWREQSFSDRKDTFKTFVASPSSNREELKLIYKKLQDFQKLRDQLKVLKQQREVLKNWIEENLSTMSTSQSLDMVTVQEEIAEIDQECARLSEELLVKRPEVESLAVRVRVLCSRPT